VYRLPGLSSRAAELVVKWATEEFPDWTPKVGRRPKLDVVGALRLCLCWLRRNMTFEELGEDFGIGTTTAWEYAHGIAKFLAELIGCRVESLQGQVAGKICLVDGTLVPTCNWRHRRDLHSGTANATASTFKSSATSTDASMPAAKHSPAAGTANAASTKQDWQLFSPAPAD
jgi:hypothetical protein